MSIVLFITKIVKNKFIGNVVLRFTQGAFSILSSILVARALGAESYGEFVTLLSVVATLSIPLAAGVPMYSQKEMASHAQENNSIVRYQFLKGLKIYMLCAAFLILMATSVWQILAEVIGVNEYKVSPILLGVIAVIIGTNIIFSGVLRGGNKVFLCNLPEMGVRSSIFLACSTLIWLMQLNDLNIVVYALLLSCLASLFVSLCFMSLINYGKVVVQDIGFRNWLGKLYPYLIASIFAILTANADLLLLAFFCRPEEVALYKIAFQMAAITPLVSTVYYNTHCHQILELYKSNSEYETIKFLRSFFFLTGFVVFGVLTTFILFGDGVLIKFYGNQYLDAYNPLLILTLSQGMLSILGMGIYVLNITGNPKAVLESNALLFLTNVLLGFVLIPLYGAIGASVANILSVIVGCIFACSIAWGLFNKKNYA